MPAYATAEQLAAFPGGTPLPEDAEGLLVLASDDVAVALLTAVYDVDAAGLPSDPAVAEVVARATCAQALWLDETGDRTGASARWQSAALGPASYTRAPAAAGGGGSCGPRAVSILRSAGLLPGTVYTEC